MWNRVSLRVRLTAVSALIITAVCICLTAVSISSATRIAVFYQSFNRFDGFVVNEAILVPSKQNEKISPPSGAIPEPTREFNRTSIYYMLALIAIGTALTYLISGWTLKPIHELSDIMESIDENSLDKRVEMKNSGMEVMRIAESFNQMLSTLEASFESRKLFAQHAAHELKTPLSSIMTNIEVLQMEENPNPEEYREVIDVVKESTERLIRIVLKLLQINASLCQEHVKAIDLRVMVNRIFAELKPLAAEKEILLTNRCNGEINGDPELLFHAFFNLIHNAVRYNTEHGEVTVSTENGAVVIRDTGIGIPEEDLKNIFEPFYCVDPSRSRKLGGSGLGLSVVRAIVQKHNGVIQMESQMGKGTAVTVAL